MDFEVDHAKHPLKLNSHHHVAIEVSYVLCRCFDDATAELESSCYDYLRADYQGLIADLARFNWDALFSGGPADGMIDTFYDHLSTLINLHVPRRRKRRTYAEPWMTRETARLRNRRNRVHRAWKRSGTQPAWSHFLELREEYLQHCSAAYQEDLESQAERLRSSPRSFWRIVRDSRETISIPRRMRNNSMASTSSLESAGLLTEYFQSNYAPQLGQHQSPHSRGTNFCGFNFAQRNELGVETA